MITKMDSTFFSLPLELQTMIKEFLAPETIVFTNKTNYNTYHSVLRQKLIPLLNIEKYIRDMVSRDLDYVFLTLCRENHERWLHMKGYRYQDKVCTNYFYFLKVFCVEKDATKCLHALKTSLKEKGITLHSPKTFKGNCFTRLYI